MEWVATGIIFPFSYMMDAKFYVNWFVGSWMCDNIGRYIS
jgi:hypothetical protein